MAYGKREKPMTEWTPERIKELRESYHESQTEFAARFRVGVDTLRKWEQNRANPGGTVTVVLDHLLETLPKNGNGHTNGRKKAAGKT